MNSQTLLERTPTDIRPHAHLHTSARPLTSARPTYIHTPAYIHTLAYTHTHACARMLACSQTRRFLRRCSRGPTTSRPSRARPKSPTPTSCGLRSWPAISRERSRFGGSKCRPRLVQVLGPPERLWPHAGVPEMSRVRLRSVTCACTNDAVVPYKQ